MEGNGVIVPSQESIQLIVEIRRKPFWKILINFPKAMKLHYKIFRRHLPIYKAVYGAWLMAGVSLRVGK